MLTNFDYLNTSWNILVIDDSKLNRAIIKNTLSELNMKVDEASDGMEGLNALKQKKYDLILVDIVMPNLDGFGFLSRFKDVVGSDFVPAILMTGTDDLNSKIKGLTIGADDFLLKPLNEKELVARVLSLLRLKWVYSELYEKNQQITRELDIAKRVQQFIIPRDFSQIPYPRVSGRYSPIEDIGGDFFDFYLMPEDRYGFLIADVTGHGIPAALVMSMAKMIFSIYSSRLSSTREVFQVVNEKLHGSLLDTQYITSFFVIYDHRKKVLRYSNAGHTRALFYRAHKRQVLALDTLGFFIGISDTTQYEEKAISVSSGDRLLLYTDGLTEIKNDNGTEFGEIGLARFISECHHLTGDVFCDHLLKEIKSFASTSGHLDDIAFLNIEF